MQRVSGAWVGHDCAPLGSFFGGQPAVDVGRGVASDAGVAMLVVVPLGEGFHKFPCLTE